jgi:DNA repair protein RecO (recombination protein O)
MNKRATSAPLQGYVLHHWDWSETSLIVDLFTRERGRLAAAAKGAKRPYSQLRPVLLPFQRLHLTLGRTPADANAEVHLLRHAEWAGGAPMLSGGALFSGFYANELLMKLLARDDPHPRLFDAYAQTLPSLRANGVNGVNGMNSVNGDDSHAQAALRAFELLLLHETGVLPELGRVTLTQQAVVEKRRYQLVPEAGVIAARDDVAALDASQLLALQAALVPVDLAALQRACLVALPALRAALRALLHYHLGATPLRTRQVMQGVQRLLEVRQSSAA